MNHQALARKWRPRSFSELSGQEHVVTALANALERGRLHHAYLLTGTRGVGKTTIARILAKSLNCESGVTASPCGACAACLDIDAGRFVDLLELDAASNTGIDNMREILDNARYAPTVGRYKVYLIDEVHMLSKQAFNSMLKTLEEPPEHVKFVLATTDPQKIPVTVLSRCLQFSLKQLPVPLINERMKAILDAEGIGFDARALDLVARAAQGSMRDALSILDQAIAHGAGEVRDEAVRAMLGTVDADYVFALLDSVVAQDGAALVGMAQALAERGVALGSVLDELATVLSRVAIAQSVPGTGTDRGDGERIDGFAGRIAPELVQLYYQICIQSRADLDLAPDELTGLTMALLRLHAFTPSMEGDATIPAPSARPAPGQDGRAAEAERRRAGAGDAPKPRGGGSVDAPVGAPPLESRTMTAAGSPSSRMQGSRGDRALPTPADAGFSPASRNAGLSPAPENARLSPPSAPANASLSPASKNAGLPPAPENARLTPAPANATHPPTSKNGGLPPAPENASLSPASADAGRSPARADLGFLPAPVQDVRNSRTPALDAPSSPAPVHDVGVPAAPARATGDSGASPLALPDRAGWPAFVASLHLSAITLQLAAQTELREVNGSELVLDVAEDARHLTGKAYTEKLKFALESALARRIRLRIEVVPATSQTLGHRDRSERASARAQTEASLRDDPFVQDVLSRFDARLNPDSIKPVS